MLSENGHHVLTHSETATALGVAFVTVSRWARDGRLHPIRSNPFLFTEADVKACAAGMVLELGPLVIEAAKAS